MRLWNVVLKCIREQRRDLWVLGLSLAFAPLFVLLYYWMTGGTGSTSYSVLVINRDVPAALANGSMLSAGSDVVQGLRGVAYKSGNPLLKVAAAGDETLA